MGRPAGILQANQPMNLQKGVYIIIEKEPFEVLEVQHSRFAQRRAVLRTRLKSLVTGNVYNKTFQATEKFEEAEIAKEKAQYLYREGNLFYFMNEANYEQFSLTAEQLGDKAHYLIEGTVIEIMKFNDKPISISLPIKMSFKVTSAPPGIKGDTAQGGSKAVTIETGLQVTTPLFVNEGDKILVDTRNGEYVEKVNN